MSVRVTSRTALGGEKPRLTYKAANVLFAVEATRRWAGDGITANALLPSRSTPTSGAAPAADGAALQEQGVALVRDGGLFVGVKPGAVPAGQRGVSVAQTLARGGISGRYRAPDTRQQDSADPC
jgi:NAD(P)-dependent dehydrogenase (short-subunit alcohol dehydrogenase family)